MTQTARGWTDDDPRGETYPPGDPSAWYHLAWSHEVRPDRPLGVDSLGEQFVLFRTAEGTVAVLDRFCPHLGADLASGKVDRGRLVCPFHRWQFDGQGHLCHVPAGGKIPPIRARRWEVREVGGMVFVWRGHRGEPAPDGWDDPLGGPLDGLRPVGHKRVDGVRIHVLEMAENTVDNQHFVPLHSEMRVPWTRWRVPGVTVHHDTRWEHDPDRDWVIRFTDDAHLSFLGRDLPRTGAHALVSFVGPGAVVRLEFRVPDLGRVCLFQTQTPSTPMRQRVSFRWFAEPRVPSLAASYVVGEWYSQWLLDVDIWERKVYRHRPQLVAADGPIHEVRRWYGQFYPGRAMTLPMPRGWFAVAHEEEVRAGGVLTRRIGDRERVLFRDGRGEVAAVDPYCPHLGAHLGRGGRVREGALECPFHGLRFDKDGGCVHTPGGGRAPRRARLRTHPVVESGGWVFTWLDPDGAPPTWRPPVLVEPEWGPLRTHCVPLRAHPQETTENSVDIGHFPFVHGYRDVRLHTLEADGPHLHTRYSFVRPNGLPLLGSNLPVEIDVHVWGLGFSYVDVFLPTIGLHTRHYVLPTPVASDGIELRLGTALRRGVEPAWVIRWLPRWLFDRAVGPFVMRGYVRDVLADREIWEHKIHLDRPALTADDAPIARYRAWVRQFYGANAG